MSKKHYDFAGWATRNDIRCSDGRTIRHGAFSGDDGKRVPLVWMHNHKDSGQVLGHADLEERDEGIYAYCSLNGTTQGQNAKEYVEHGDIVALSIYANELKQKGGDVLHGAIKEVSLVLAGANRGAIIDSVLSHGEISEEEAEISFVGYGDIIIHKDDDEDEEEENENENDEEGEEPEEDESDDEDEEEDEKEKPVKHADEGDDDGETVADIMATLSEKQKKAVAIIIHQLTSGKGDKNLSHADDQNEQSEEGETVEDVYNTLNEKQKKVVAFIVEKATEQKEGGSEMKHNVFADGETVQENIISHDDFMKLMKVGKQMGSIKEAYRAGVEEGVLAHADGDYGVRNLEYLFPEAKTINTTPEFIKRETDWVDKVLGATHHTPFSRVKSIFADITEDDARARGYIKGKLKKEEVFGLLKRTTEPQTIYKKQKLDKDDIDDITDMNIVAWIKAEMQLMLKEELARAILIGDGRPASSDDKIRETNIRPVYNDADLFTVKVPVVVPNNATDDVVSKAIIRAMVKSRKQYKGSGNPTFFTTEDVLTDALLLEDGIGHVLYDSEAKVATAMRVSSIVPVEVMEGKTIEIDENGTKKTYPLIGTYVNLKDYNVGTNGGAKTDFFDDFDIDFNQYKYLYETRMSGALIKPFSAVSFYLVRE